MKHTGHPEIDRQHDQLAQLIQGLEGVCAEQARTGTPCLACKPEDYESCNERLANVIYDLLSFMLEHFAYEEKLMRLLLDTEENRRHIRNHQQAHSELSRLLSEMTARLDRDNPKQSSVHLQHIVDAWIGGHTDRFDSVLAESLGGAYDAEIKYDLELTQLLTS